jgi:hypothetical protein
MDIIDLKEEIKLFNETTMPRLEGMIANLCAELSALVNRLDGLTFTLKLSEKKNEKISVVGDVPIDVYPSGTKPNY